MTTPSDELIAELADRMCPDVDGDQIIDAEEVFALVAKEDDGDDRPS